MRSASGVFCADATPAQPAAAASATTIIEASDRHRPERAPITYCCAQTSTRCLARNVVDRAILLVGHQHRTVRHLEDIGWPAIELVLCRIEKTGHERLDRGGAVRLRPRHDNVVSEFLLPVPRTAPGDEGNVAIGLREHGAGVELDAETGGMRPGERSRQDDASARIG